MANNLFADVPAATVAKQTISFASAGFNASNVYIIYEVGSPMKSWVPGRPINPVTTFTENKGYYIVPKATIDMEAIVAPPLPTGGGGAPAAPTAGVVDDSANTFNWTNNPLFPNVSEMEQTLNGGSSWEALTAKPIAVGDINKAIGQVGVRVRAIGGNPASAGLFNATAFTPAAGFEAEAQALFTAIETTHGETITSGEKSIVNAWYAAYKAPLNVYAKVLAAYLVVGGVIGRRLNGANPVNSDAAKRLVPVVGTVIDASGVLTDGVDDYFKANIKDGEDLPLADFTIMFYNRISRAANDSRYILGDLGGGNGTYLNLRSAAGNLIGRIQGGGDAINVANAETRGHWSILHRIETPGTLNRRKVLRDAATVYNVPYDPTVGPPTLSDSVNGFFFGTFNSTDVPAALYENAGFSILVLCDSALSDAEEAQARAANVNYVTNMSRLT